MHKKSNCRGINLMELIAVIIIIGIVAVIAIPSYNRSRERAFGQETRANLKLIAAAEKIYNLESIDNSWYFSGVLGDINTNLRLSLSGNPIFPACGTNWCYSIANVATFTASGQRVAGFGNYSNCNYSLSLDNYNNGVEPVPSSTVDCPP